jgi:hypothetical protein
VGLCVRSHPMMFSVAWWVVSRRTKNVPEASDPRRSTGMIVAGRAIVSTGSYGPKGYDNDQEIMLGAEAADGNDLIRVVRDQIGKGADFIKVYADYRWGTQGEDQPSFTLDELKLINEVTRSSGRYLVCHAKSKEAMRRAILVLLHQQGDFFIYKVSVFYRFGASQDGTPHGLLTLGMTNQIPATAPCHLIDQF